VPRKTANITGIDLLIYIDEKDISMKKYIALTMAALALTLSLTACRPNIGGTNVTTVTPTNRMTGAPHVMTTTRGATHAATHAATGAPAGTGAAPAAPAPAMGGATTHAATTTHAAAAARGATTMRGATTTRGAATVRPGTATPTATTRR